MPVIKKDSPAGDALRREFRRILRTAVRELTNGDTPHPADAHSPRKRLKLLRSLLVMMRPALNGKTFKRTDSLLRRAGKTLSKRRKAEAMVETVAKLRQSKHTLRELSVFDALEAIATEQLADAGATHAEATNLVGLKNQLRDLKGRVKTWTLPAGDPKPYIEGMGDAYRRARKRLRRGLATGRTADLHRARKSVIHHLHHVETLEAIWPSLFILWTQQLDELRTRLGELNDYDELEGIIARAGDRFTPTALGIANRLIAKRRDPLKQAIALSSARLFEEKPQAFTSRIDKMWRAFAA
jgi:CHAD domain-containing protein